MSFIFAKHPTPNHLSNGPPAGKYNDAKVVQRDTNGSATGRIFGLLSGPRFILVVGALPCPAGEQLS